MMARSRSSSVLSGRGGRPAAPAVSPASVVQGSQQAAAQARQGDVGVDLVQADLDVPPADLPAAGHVVPVVAARRAVRGATQQRALEPVDLGRAAGDDLAGVGVALDLGVEIVDQSGQNRIERLAATDWTRRASSSVQPTYCCSS